MNTFFADIFCTTNITDKLNLQDGAIGDSGIDCRKTDDSCIPRNYVSTSGWVWVRVCVLVLVRSENTATPTPHLHPRTWITYSFTKLFVLISRLHLLDQFIHSHTRCSSIGGLFTFERRVLWTRWKSQRGRLWSVDSRSDYCSAPTPLSRLTRSWGYSRTEWQLLPTL